MSNYQLDADHLVSTMVDAIILIDNFAKANPEQYAEILKQVRKTLANGVHARECCE